LIDEMLDHLFETLYLGKGGPLLDARMALTPNPDAASHFITAPRPRMTRQDMTRIGEQGLMAELALVLDDLPAGRREEVLAQIQAIMDALAAQAAADTTAEPPSLIYALH